MLQPHRPLFSAATDAPVAPAAPTAELPKDFSHNTVTEPVSTFEDTGDAPFGSEGTDAPITIEPAKAGDPPIQQAPLKKENDFEPEPLPEAMQAPAKEPEPAKQEPAVDPLTALTAAMRLAHPNESASQIANRVAASLQEAEAPTPPEPEPDPDQVELEKIGTQLEALQQQAQEEGTSDYDQQIRALEKEQIKLETRLSVRQEIQETAQIENFAQEATKWDIEAGRSFPDADKPGSPLNAAVNQRLAQVKATDPDFFNRSPDAGFQLVAAEAAKLGLAPIPRQNGTAPAPQGTAPIKAPVALPGSMQGSHRPADTPAQDPTKAFFAKMIEAEKNGLASELDLASEFTAGALHGVSFAG